MAAPIVSRRSIEDFKANLSNGGVRPTMYEVDIVFPRAVVTAMGDTAEQLTTSARFLVKASTMPGSQIGMIEVPFRGRKLKVSGDRNFANWSTTVINDNTFKIRGALEKWSQIIQNHNYAIGHEQLQTGTGSAGEGQDSGYFGTAEVRQLDRQGKQLRVYQFNGIWPMSMADIQLSFETQDTIEEYDVEFCYQYWTSGGPSAETAPQANVWTDPATSTDPLILV